MCVQNSSAAARRRAGHPRKQVAGRAAELLPAPSSLHDMPSAASLSPGADPPSRARRRRGCPPPPSSENVRTRRCVNPVASAFLLPFYSSARLCKMKIIRNTVGMQHGADDHELPGKLVVGTGLLRHDVARDGRRRFPGERKREQICARMPAITASGMKTSGITTSLIATTVMARRMLPRAL